MKTIKIDVELKPCPFCGKTEYLNLYHNEGEDLGDSYVHESYTINCNAAGNVDEIRGCGATSGYRKTMVEAVEQWNRRD